MVHVCYLSLCTHSGAQGELFVLQERHTRGRGRLYSHLARVGVIKRESNIRYRV